MTPESDSNPDLVQDFWNPVYAFLRADGRNHDEASVGLQMFFNAWVHDHTATRLRLSVLAQLTAFNPKDGSASGSNCEFDFDWCRRRFDAWPSNEEPEMIFDREWTDVLVQKCMQKVETEYLRRGRAKEYRILSRTVRGRRIPAKELAHMLNISISEANRGLQQLRQRLRHSFGLQVAETADEHEFAAEIQHVSGLAPAIFQ